MRQYLFDAWGILTSLVFYPVAEWYQGRQITPKLRVLRQEAAAPFAIRRARAKERLIQMLEHAGRTVPYYREVFARVGFNPQKFSRDEGYLQDLPVLTKGILREQGKRLVSELYLDRLVREQKTGGSTGPAATIYYDQASLDWTAAQNLLMLSWGGKRRYQKEAHLSTRFPGRPCPEQARHEWFKCLAMNRRNIFTSGFDDESQKRLLADLKHASVRFVQGHPSSMYALARYLERCPSIDGPLFDVFVSTGEMLEESQRKRIEQVLGVRVSNRYGACEFGVMAQERVDGPRGALMVSDSLVWPEQFCSGNGQNRELLFSNLRNPAMPLLRYHMGDLGMLEEKTDGWWITQLAGRIHDEVEIAGIRYPTHYLQDILDRCGPIQDFQIAVNGVVAQELRLVCLQEQWNAVRAAVSTYFPALPLRRIESEELVFTGIRGKFSYIVRLP